MDNKEELEELSETNQVDSSSFSSGNSLASKRRPENNSKQYGREEYEKTLGNRNYYNDKLKENQAQRRELEQQLKDSKRENSDLGKTLEQKNKNVEDSKNALSRLKHSPRNTNRDDATEKRLQDNKNRRNNINQANKNYKAAQEEQKKAEAEKKASDEKVKENENALKKNELERKGLEKDKAKSKAFALKHPLEATKMRAGNFVKNALKKLGKLLVLKIVLPIILVLVILATLIMVIYEVFESVDKVTTDVANVVEKTKNFLTGLGFQNSEDAFYEELNELQEEYNNSLDIPLLMSTLFYDEIQNNMDNDEIESKVVNNGESLLEWNSIYTWLKDKAEETQVTIGKDGFKYSSNKIYRLRMLAKHMVTTSDVTQTVSLGDYLDHYGERMGKTLKELFSAENMVQLLLGWITGGGFQVAELTSGIFKYIVQDEVFETSDLNQLLTDNIFTDAFEFVKAVFSPFSEIEGLSLCADGGVCVTYKDKASYQKNEEQYYKYLKEEYIPRMPEFKKYLNVSDGNIELEQEIIDRIIREIKEIYADYQEYFGIKLEDTEDYSSICSGNIKAELVEALKKPTDVGETVNFTAAYAYGLVDKVIHNGVDLNSNTSGNKEGDPVYSIAGDGVVMESTVDESYKCDNCKGGWVKIAYTKTINGSLYKFTAIYGGLSVESLTLKKGSSVGEGAVIGKIGNAAESESGLPSLHFGIYDDDKKTFLDPTNIFVPCTKNIRGDSLAEKMWWAMLDAGFSKEAAAGVIGNSAVETAGGDIDKITAHSLESGLSYEEVMAASNRGLGLLGWTYKDFKTGLTDFAKYKGGNWYDDDIQVEYMIHTIIANNSGNSWDKKIWYISPSNQRNGETYQNFMNAKTPERAATIFCRFYERPASNCLKNREEAARTAYDRFSNMKDPSATQVVNGQNITSKTGTLSWPIPGYYRVTSGYGKRSAPVAGASTDHKGIDIGCTVGADVVAAADGVVVTTVDYCGNKDKCPRGTYVIVDHSATSTDFKNGDLTTRYQHLSSYQVKKGDVVKRGQVIAKCGNSGIGSGPHLHFEVAFYPNRYRQDERNPGSYLGLPNNFTTGDVTPYLNIQ